jgi:hypothetical protein
MGVEIKLTDRDLPVSPGFIEFLHARIENTPIEGSWHDQLSETLVPVEFEQRVRSAEAVADRVLQHPLGQKAIHRAYELFAAILLGRTEVLEALHARFRFVCVVGCPRHGGSYLIKHLFMALGRDPGQVPNMIAHDGFPDATPFCLASRHNAYTAMMQQTAEYLAMVEVFFDDRPDHDGRIVVPKKATKAAYHGAFFAGIWGADAEYLITLRHPVAACISTYEKSSGLPADGRFAVRGNIEQWAHRDNLAMGVDPARIFEQDYFEAYLRYWEHYHCNLALSGLLRTPRKSLVAYGRDRLMACARELIARHGSTAAVEDFRVYDKRDRHPQWYARAEPVVRRVAAIWEAAGAGFPLEQVLEGW